MKMDHSSVFQAPFSPARKPSGVLLNRKDDVQTLHGNLVVTGAIHLFALLIRDKVFSR
jgi:hypothetical protein